MPKWKSHVVFLLGEMNIKESTVYDESELKIVGFVNLIEVNDQLAKFERETSNDTEPSSGEVATICDRIWENPPYGICARFAQCAFLVAQVEICQSPDFVIYM